ncbi:MAG: hypothetical protein EP330_12245 [Deltaproteobacteria bacterium]|nr:MAG: hypothetical protein EP330_12245 [Deltaproteobacteria bacterium]
MRTLLMLTLMGLAGCPSPLEICGDGVDNDGDDLIDGADGDCIGVTGAEDCFDGVDNDGDGVVDCRDADCFLAAVCLTETDDQCSNGIDDDLDEQVDCDDEDCADAANCQGAMVWELSGQGIATEDRLAYAGKMWMTDTVLDNDAGRYEIGDRLCRAEYQQLSTGSPSVACPDCDWALAVGPSTHISHSGPECDSWYNFTNAGAGNYYGVWYFPEALGYASDYRGPTTSFPSAMFLATVDDGTGTGGTITRWYAWASGNDLTWDEATGELTWNMPIGYFSYN